MFTTIFVVTITLPILGWFIWFLIEFIRYVASGEYEIDKRLRDISK